jgi:mono/diheme cytochrome c family protein
MNSRSSVGTNTPAEAAARPAVNSDTAAASDDETNPLWLLAAGMALFFAVAAVLVAKAAAPDSAVRSSYDAARGRDLYVARCSACHRADGEGVPGAFPPLKGNVVVNKDDATKHIHVVLDGLQGARVGGVVYESVMPPFGNTLSDADIADIVDYVRSSWGNHGKPVTAAQVAAERANAW